MLLNKLQIQEIIPHRHPFLFIDKIVEIEPGHSATGIKDISNDEYFFQGHFPQEPIVPGVIIIEALAQVGAVTLLAKDEYKGKLVYFAGLKDAKFRRKVLPGDQLRLEVLLTKIRSKFGVGFGKAYVGNDLACEAEFSFVVGS